MYSRFAILISALLAFGPTTLEATNGMYLSGYGAEVVGRGGANLAISDRALAINFNPAGIGQLQGNHYTFSLSVLAPQIEWENVINSSTDAETAYFPLPAFSYIRGGKETPWTWGIGLIAQGGMGAELRRTNTFFGTSDGTFSEVRFMTVTPTFAYNFNEDLAVGVSANIGYSDVAFQFWPNTSFFNQAAPQQSFFGLDMEDPAAGLQYNLRLGWWWRPRPALSVGLIYQTETESEFDNGGMTVNFEGHPFLQRRVDYTARVDGFTFASQAGIGFAFRPRERVEVALDVKRYFWDDAIDVITVTATAPSVQGAPPEVVVPFTFNWLDTWVFALGADYRVNDRWTVRGGYNYGENPVPDGTLNPLFPANVEHHLAFGFSVLRGNKTYELAVEHAFEQEQTNLNFDQAVNPFGPGSTVRHSQWLISFGMSWAKARGQ